MLIGFTGQAHSGKDTAASHLVNGPRRYKQYAFAQPMKEACKVIFGWDERHVNGVLKDVVDPRYGTSPRKALQTLGTEWGRDIINPSIWLIRAQIEIAKHRDLVITDVRFDNEAELIRSSGGIIVKVTREDTTGVMAHSSEAGIKWELIKHVVTNNGTITDLHVWINLIVKGYF